MKKQQGSAHVIVIVILVLALLGALGFIFWQNFSKESNDTTQTTTTEPKDNDTTEEVSTVPDGYIAYEDDALGFSFAYPAEWGALKDTATRANTGHLGPNGDNTKALAGSDGGTRVAVFTKDSFYAQNNAGYVLKYQGDKVVGADVGSEVYEDKQPLTGNVYPHYFTNSDLFFSVGNSVVYIVVGDASVETQTKIAETVEVK